MQWQVTLPLLGKSYSIFNSLYTLIAEETA